MAGQGDVTRFYQKSITNMIVWESRQPPRLYLARRAAAGPLPRRAAWRRRHRLEHPRGRGRTTPSTRTADQTEIALVWWESSPLKWNRIARAVAVTRGLTLWENARLFGLLNMALADGYIAMADAKNHYHFWRPITAIQEGDNDSNAQTAGDPT
jgi:hypothetical protein